MSPVIICSKCGNSSIITETSQFGEINYCRHCGYNFPPDQPTFSVKMCNPVPAPSSLSPNEISLPEVKSSFPPTYRLLEIISLLINIIGSLLWISTISEGFVNPGSPEIVQVAIALSITIFNVIVPFLENPNLRKLNLAINVVWLIWFIIEILLIGPGEIEFIYTFVLLLPMIFGIIAVSDKDRLYKDTTDPSMLGGLNVAGSIALAANLLLAVIYLATTIMAFFIPGQQQSSMMILVIPVGNISAFVITKKKMSKMNIIINIIFILFVLYSIVNSPDALIRMGLTRIILIPVITLFVFLWGPYRFSAESRLSG